MILVKKIIRNIRDYGVWVCIQKSIANVLRPLFLRRSYLIYVVDLRKVPIRAVDSSKNIVFRFISHDEEAIIRQIESMEEWLGGRVREKLKHGQRCLVALQGEMVAGFNLIGFGTFEIPLIKLSKPLRPKECFSEQITVHFKYRSKGLGGDLRQVVFRALKDAGYRKLYGGTQFSNVANRALTRKVGFKELAIGTYTRLCGCQTLKIARYHQ